MAQKMLELNIATNQRENLVKATKERLHRQEKGHHINSSHSPKERDKDYKCNRGTSPETSLQKKKTKTKRPNQNLHSSQLIAVFSKDIQMVRELIPCII